jgi:hypothetical protein
VADDLDEREDHEEHLTNFLLLDVSVSLNFEELIENALRPCQVLHK